MVASPVVTGIDRAGCVCRRRGAQDDSRKIAVGDVMRGVVGPLAGSSRVLGPPHPPRYREGDGPSG